MLRVETQCVRFDAYFGIQCAYALRRQRGFLPAAIGQRIPGLAMQVRWLEPVGVDDAEPADARAGEILQHRHAEATGADDQHGSGAQSRLALGSDFAQRDLARVVRRAAGCGDGRARARVRGGAAARRIPFRAPLAAAQRSQFTQPESPFS